MAEGEFPDGRMQKLKGKPWTSWNLPEQPTDLDLRKLRDSFSPPEQYRAQHQSTPLTARSMLLFGTHPDSDFLSITKCPACGWLLKVQHANRHFLRDSRGAIVCKDSDLAIFGSKVLGKAIHPLVELKDTYSRKITLRLLPSSYSAPKSVHSLRGMPLMNEMVSKSRSGSHSSSKTDYISHSSYRSRSHTQVQAPPPNSYSKSRSGSNATSSSSTHHSSLSLNSSSSKGKSGKSHSSSSSSWSSLRSNTTSSTSSSSKPSGTHKTTQGSYTLSIPSDDMGQNESVEDILMSNVSHNYGSSKHTVHIIATSNSSKSKSSAAATTDPDYDHHVKFLPEVPEKRIKLDSSHSRGSDYYHKSSSLSHGCTDSHSGSHDSFSKSKSKYSSSLVNGTVSSHGSSDSSKSKSKSSSMSSSSSHAKNDLSSSSKHHLRSTSSSTIVTTSKPIVAVSSLTSSSSSSQLRSHHLGSLTTTISSSSSEKDKDRDKDRSSSAKKKKRKRDKDEPRKIIPLKDRDFNPDKHCGVCVPGSVVPCKRSLTCKTHSMALRRAVTGRSQSFDALLAAHKLAKTEEKKSQTKEVIEEIAPPKAKKKKLSGSSSTIVRSSPNDLGTLVGAVEATSYGRSKSPDIEVIAVKAKPKPAKPEIEIVNYYPKKIKKICPLVYPYTPDHQTKFETFWYDPTTMERNTQMTIEEKNKFMFLLKHYKNPYFINSDDVKPTVAKSPREKRNVFSNWNASEKPIGGRQHVVSWTTVETKRPVSETDTGDLRYLCAVAKK